MQPGRVDNQAGGRAKKALPLAEDSLSSFGPGITVSLTVEAIDQWWNTCLGTENLLVFKVLQTFLFIIQQINMTTVYLLALRM